jgi:hypothetical protein
MTSDRDDLDHHDDTPSGPTTFGGREVESESEPMIRRMMITELLTRSQVKSRAV